MATVTIPGALADHLTGQTIADAETVGVLDAARRGRGRTLVIEPTSTRVLHVISAYAEAIIENRTLHTAAEVRAARLWIQRAGHASPAPAAEQAPAAVRDQPSDWWTITDPDTGEEIARVYGKTYQEMTPRAEALPEVAAVIRKHRGFSRRRLHMSELTPSQLADQVEALYAAAQVAEAKATNGTWQGEWIGQHTADDALFDIEPAADQGALFDNRATAPTVSVPSTEATVAPEQHQPGALPPAHLWAVEHLAAIGGEWVGRAICGVPLKEATAHADALRHTGSRAVEIVPCSHGPEAHPQDDGKPTA